MSADPVPRRRFLGAAAALSALPAIGECDTSPDEASGESGDSAHGRAPEDIDARLDDPLRGRAGFFAKSGHFRVDRGHKVEEAAGELRLDAYGEEGHQEEAVELVHRTDSNDMVYLHLDPDVAEEVGEILVEFAERARAGDRRTHP